MGTADRKIEDLQRELDGARAERASALLKWARENGPSPETADDLTALEFRFNVEHPGLVERLNDLATDVNAAQAELNRRWVEAHEDFQALRKAGMGLAPRPASTPAGEG